MFEVTIYTLNNVAATIAANLLNTAAIACTAIAAAVLLSRGKRWSAASRYGLSWLMLAFVIAAPFAFSLLPSRQISPTISAPAPGIAAFETITPATNAPTYVQLAPIVRLSNAAILLLCWGATAVFQMIRLALGFSYGLRLKRNSEPPASHLEVLFYRLCTQSTVRRNVTLCISRELLVPAAVGYCQPKILIPEDLSVRLTPAELEQVLLHELAHIARYDDWTIAAQRFIEAVFVWHPLIRYLGYRLSRDREMVCDDLVAALHEPKRYAACLAKVAEIRPFYRSNAVLVPLLERKSELLARVEMLLDKTRTHIPRASGRRLLLASVGFLLLGAIGAHVPKLMASAPPEVLSAPQVVPPVPPEPPSPQAVPPAPPTPREEDPAMPKHAWTHTSDGKNSGIYSVVVTSEDGHSSMFGNWSGYTSGDGGREPGTIEYKANKKVFIIRDKAVLVRAEKILQPMEDLGRRQSELGEQQSKLGELQSRLGEQQEKVADRRLDPAQAEKLVQELQELKTDLDRMTAKVSAGKMQELKADMDKMTANEAQKQLVELQSRLAELQSEIGSAQGRIGEAQGRLSEQQAKLGAEQAILGKQQAELGNRQAAESGRTEKALEDLIRDSQSLAKQVR